jgi:hypothetical protein
VKKGIRGFTEIEQMMFMRVDNCPNNYTGPCGFVHTCVVYETDENGVVQTKEKEQ